MIVPLLYAGVALVCFADREMGSISTSAVTISVRYPVFGVMMIIAGLVLS